MRRTLAFRLSLALTGLLAACQNAKAPVAADPRIGHSFSVALLSDPPPPATADRARVTIKKAALDKEFLFQANQVLQDLLPSFNGTRSRVITFHQVDNKIYMIESSRGRNLAQDYPQTLPLAEFPILREDGDGLMIDFNAGLSSLYVGSDWRSRDFGRAMPFNIAVHTQFTYIDRASTVNDDVLEIHQKALVELPFSGVVETMAVEVVYALKPYIPNPEFTPTVAPTNLDRLGFFEATTVINSQSGLVHYATKHDLSKPIVFAISANTPAEYRDAIREGVLYWNKAFGREAVQVVEAPPGEVAPNLKYNLIQWVDFQSATFAYADAQIDPLTGEILHHQIYLPSGWIHALRKDIDQFQQTGQFDFGLRGFAGGPLCQFKPTDAFAQEFQMGTLLLDDQAKAAKILRDTYRWIVSHEVGHTLGLRHNFAGTLAANYQPADRDQLRAAYVETGSTPEGTVVSSSVMDYPRPTELLLMGDQIAKSPKAFSYDEKAIQYLYFGQKTKASEMPLFCTDSAEYPDCQAFDVGPSFVAWTKYKIPHDLTLIPYRLLARFIEAKTPAFGEAPMELSEVPLRPGRTAALIMDDVRPLIDLFRSDARLLSVERQFAHHEPAEKAEIRAKTLDVLRAEISLHGKLGQVLPSIHPGLGPTLFTEFERLLARPEMIHGTTIEGKEYSFTSEELLYMREAGRRFFDQLQKDLSAYEVSVLAGESPFDAYVKETYGVEFSAPAPKPFDDSDLAADLAQHIAKRASQYLFATTGAPDVYRRETTSNWILPGAVPGASTQDAISLNLPHFLYPLDLRKKAAGLLASGRAESPAWGYLERRALEQQFDAMISTALPGISSVSDPGSLEMLPAPIVRWLLETREMEAVVKTTGAPSTFPPAGAKTSR